VPANTRVSGSYKNVSKISVRVGGAWKEVSKGFTKVSGAWKEFFSLAPAGSYDLLETSILTSDAASVTFSNLGNYASDYQHLQIRAVTRSTVGSGEDFQYIQLNGDTASNYRSHYLTGTGSSVVSGDITSSYPAGILDAFGTSGASFTANSFGVSVIDLLDAYETKNKTVRILSGQAGTLNRIALSSGVRFNTAAISSVTLDAVFGNYAQYSRFSLYGYRKI
jgi:hypothetical protein